jgi:hypothetical protein
MVNAKLNQSICNNAIEQYSFYKDNLLNTTYGNIVKRNLTSLNLYASWMPLKNTRLFVNGGVSYSDLRSDELDARNSGWQANAMAGIQQTLPADFRLSLFAITSSKSYTLQGWSSGFNMITGSITKSLFNDKLNIGVQGMIGLNGGNLKIESYSRSADFTNHMNISVPISNISLNVSFTFGNSKKQQQKIFRSRVENDYMEHQSDEERINNAGSQENGQAF